MKSGDDAQKAVGDVLRWSVETGWRQQKTEILDDLLRQFENVSANSCAHRPDFRGAPVKVLNEDFLSRRFSPGNRNVIDDYLSHRSSNNRRQLHYLEQLRDSVLSLYVVRAVDSGGRYSLYDLIQQTNSTGVVLGDRALTLRPGDHLAARILRLDEVICLTEGYLVLPTERATELLDRLKCAQEEAERRYYRLAGGTNSQALDTENFLHKQLLRSAVPLIVQFWLNEGSDRTGASC